MEQISDFKMDTERKCVKCGAALEANQKYCPNCGTDNMMMSQRICSNCRSVIGANMTFCPNCGASNNYNEIIKENKKKLKPFYKKPVFWIIIIIVALIIVGGIGSSDNNDASNDTKVVNEVNVEEIVNEILELKNTDIEEMQSLYEQGKQYMTDEQKEQCLNQYRKWTAYNYAVNDMKEKMKNPKSFEVESGSVTTPFEFEGKMHVDVEITYYGTNSFGGELRESSKAAVAFTDSDDEMGDIYIEYILWY